MSKETICVLAYVSPAVLMADNRSPSIWIHKNSYISAFSQHINELIQFHPLDDTFLNFVYSYNNQNILPSSKHCTILPTKGIHVLAGEDVTDLAITPVQIGKQFNGTPLLSQQSMWFLPPAPQRISLWNSLPQISASDFNCDMLASYEHNGKHILLRPAPMQHSVTLYIAFVWTSSFATKSCNGIVVLLTHVNYKQKANISSNLLVFTMLNVLKTTRCDGSPGPWTLTAST